MQALHRSRRNGPVTVDLQLRLVSGCWLYRIRNSGSRRTLSAHSTPIGNLSLTPYTAQRFSLVFCYLLLVHECVELNWLSPSFFLSHGNKKSFIHSLAFSMAFSHSPVLSCHHAENIKMSPPQTSQPPKDIRLSHDSFTRSFYWRETTNHDCAADHDISRSSLSAVRFYPQ